MSYQCDVSNTILVCDFLNYTITNESIIKVPIARYSFFEVPIARF